MNREIYRVEFEELQIVENLDNNKIRFTSGKEISIVDSHGQECCEHVYADWSNAKHVLPFLEGKKVKEVIIKTISEMGFVICFNDDWDIGAKVFIPCYNEQNGYYSSDLSLEITYEDRTIKVDISGAVEDRIN